MGAEIGDSIAVDGRAGEVVGFAEGRPLVRPFPIGEQENTPGPPPCFVAQGEPVILKKHFERTTIADIERQRIEGHARLVAEQARAAHYERAARDDRGWHRERRR